MELNYDCVRDVMIALEGKLEVTTSETNGVAQCKRCPVSLLFEIMSLQDYTKEEIAYTVKKLVEAGMLMGETRGAASVEDITFAGHEFLRTIKDDSIWKKVRKFISTATSSASLSVVSTVATRILTEALLNPQQGMLNN